MNVLVSIMLLFSSIKPTEIRLGLIQKGKASFYSKRFHGSRTTSGERHRHNELTAAHLSLPMNTLVEVTNLANNQSVVVRINDRGPHGKGRIIDLAYSAAKAIGMVRTGIATVAIRVVKQKTRSALTDPSTALLYLPDNNPELVPVLAPVYNN